jgi:hypothetical protein
MADQIERMDADMKACARDIEARLREQRRRLEQLTLQMA